MLVICIINNIDIFYIHTHTHTHCHCAFIALVMSLYQSHTDNVASVSQLSSLSSSGVTAVIHQRRLINQKCQQHLLLSPPVTVATSGGGGAEIYLSFCLLNLVTQDSCQSVPVNAGLNW